MQIDIREAPGPIQTFVSNLLQSHMGQPSLRLGGAGRENLFSSVMSSQLTRDREVEYVLSFLRFGPRAPRNVTWEFTFDKEGRLKKSAGHEIERFEFA